MKHGGLNKADENQETGLAPCPFCGNQNAHLFIPTCRPETKYNPADRLYPWVRCPQCYAEAIGKNENYKGESAIKAWNHRVQGSGENAEKLARLSEKDARDLRIFIGEDEPCGVSEITISFGEGHSGHGLYVWLTEYPEEGALFFQSKESSSKPETLSPQTNAER